MIPYPIGSLKDVTVLVTRPAAQATKLCEGINARGGEAIAFPTIVIEPLPLLAVIQEVFDWLIFTSVNAVLHGLPLVTLTDRTRIAAIGEATAAALSEREIRVDATPTKANSETLLAHPAFATVATQSVLIVKGVGGRELLQDELTQRGARVTMLETYRRAQPHVDASLVTQVEQRWQEGINIVTLTSLEALDNLYAMLTETGRAILKNMAFVTPSQRIADGARAKLLQGQCVLSRGADDAALIGAIAAWHARAR